MFDPLAQAPLPEQMTTSVALREAAHLALYSAKYADTPGQAVERAIYAILLYENYRKIFPWSGELNRENEVAWEILASTPVAFEHYAGISTWNVAATMPAGTAVAPLTRQNLMLHIASCNSLCTRFPGIDNWKVTATG